MNERANKEEFLAFSPKDFISGPYIECPKCHNNTFGVLGIHDTKYSRRCSHCFFPTYQRNEHWDCYKLPALNKKIIYLDQFCISNMAKFLTPNIRNQKGIASFWGVLFSKLDSLCKLQLIICPESCIHKNESLLSKHFSSLKRIYQHFSHNVSFYDFETIRRFQIGMQLKKWLGDKDAQELEAHRIISGNINAWQEKHLLTVNVQDPDSLILELQTTRERIDLSFERVCKRWQTEKSKKFEYWFEQEIKGYASGLCELYMKQIKDYFLMSMGLSPFNLNSVLPNEAVILFNEIKDALKQKGLNEQEVNKKLVEFLNSKEFQVTPSIKISALLYAGFARQIANGKKKVLTQGFANDSDVISSLLPYCDAMFIDNECRNLLNERPISTEIKYDTKIFSLSNKEDFLKYLDSVGSSATKAHLLKVKEVYGEDWAKPYWEILN